MPDDFEISAREIIDFRFPDGPIPDPNPGLQFPAN